jgi:hypothetical protein
MAASFTCDGCSLIVDKPVKVGFVIPREYCQKCAAKAKAFLDAEEAERMALSSVFAGKREKLIAQYGADNFLLPDVP